MQSYRASVKEIMNIISNCMYKSYFTWILNNLCYQITVNERRLGLVFYKSHIITLFVYDDYKLMCHRVYK